MCYEKEQGSHVGNIYSKWITKAVWKVRGLVAVRRCYAEGGGDLCHIIVVGVT
jgi:hypothetical protein